MRDAVAVAQLAQRAHIGHAHRLPAGHVDRPGQADVGDLVRADLVDQRLQLVQVDVALEGMQVGRVVRFVDDHVHERAAGQFLVQAGGGEVHVAGDDVARLDQRLADQVLGAASLVGGHDVAVAVVRLDGFFQVVEVAAAGVGFVAQHHARPLAVAHGAGAAVGQQVDVDIVGAQQEGVVAGFRAARWRASRP